MYFTALFYLYTCTFLGIYKIFRYFHKHMLFFQTLPGNRANHLAFYFGLMCFQLCNRIYLTQRDKGHFYSKYA